MLCRAKDKAQTATCQVQVGSASGIAVSPKLVAVPSPLREVIALRTLKRPQETLAEKSTPGEEGGPRFADLPPVPHGIPRTSPPITVRSMISAPGRGANWFLDKRLAWSIPKTL